MGKRRRKADAAHEGPGPVDDGAVTPAVTRAVETRAVTKRFSTGTDHEMVALESIDLVVDDGEVVALLGPSGCGKSTMLRLIGGLLSPTSGRVSVYGTPVTQPAPIMGMMFQKPVLFPWLTVMENILLPIRVRGSAARREGMDRHRDHARELVQLVGLEGFSDRYPWQLSGGMQQRVAICRMLINEPRLLLLDEPFGALDELTREHMDSELRRIITADRRSAVLVTHSPIEAVFVADRVVVMTPRPGRIAGEVEVDLGPERRADLFSSPDLHRHVASVRELFESYRSIGE